jgi:hypothetical protein
MRKRELERALDALLTSSKESYRLQLEAAAAGYSIRIVKTHRSTAAKIDLTKLVGA